VALEVDTAALGTVRVQHSATISDADPKAANTQQDPDRVTPGPLDASVEDGVLRVELPPISWSCIQLTEATLT
jgi:alpha-L-arabinofuranosidase